MIKKFIFFCVVLSLLITLSACGSGSSNGNEKSANKDDEKVEYTVDWSKCLEDLKESVLNQEFYPYAKDVGVVVDDDQNRIAISIVVSDDTSPETALDYADTVVRQYNLMASTQDSNIASGSKDYYGGLYDQYDVLIGVAPQSKTGYKDAWFVSDAILSGAHNKIRLQNVSVDNAKAQDQTKSIPVELETQKEPDPPQEEKTIPEPVADPAPEQAAVQVPEPTPEPVKTRPKSEPIVTSAPSPEPTPEVKNDPEEAKPAASAGNSGNTGGGSGNASNFDTYDNAEQQQTTDKWVLNTKSKKIHYRSCNDVKKIAPQNYSTSNSEESELISQGYTTCGHCHK